jgi:hypothetical protein
VPHPTQMYDTLMQMGRWFGADQALRFARKAKVAGFRLPLICPVDPVSWDSTRRDGPRGAGR